MAACTPSPTPPAGSSGPTGPEATTSPSTGTIPSPSPSAVPPPGHELYGFIPYWEMDDTIAAHLAATPLTTAALFSVTNTSRGGIDQTQPGYKRITGAIGAAMVAAAHGRGARVELVFTSFGASRNATFFARPALQDATISSLVGLVGTLGIDGVDVDVEGLDIGSAAVYGAFVGRLRAAVVAADPRHTVSVATGPGPTGAAMAAAAVVAGADRVFLMGYDYRTTSSDAGAVSPIERTDGGRSLTWTLDLYSATGIPPERLLLGLPLYGIAWPVAGPVVGAPATDTGSLWILRNHIDVLTNPAAVPTTDPTEAVEVYFLGSDGSLSPPSPSAAPVDSGPPSPSVGSAAPSLFPSAGAASQTAATDTASPSAAPTWTGVYVDSPDTLARKLALGESRGLVGGGFWAIGYERGLPDYTDLMTRFVAGEIPPAG
jgi:hypothetical protein